MKYNIPLPRVLDANGNELRRLNVVDASVNLSLVPLSTAQITLPIFENLNVRDWVQMYTSQGSVGVFRVRSPKQNYRMESKQYTLDHGIAEVGDYMIKNSLDLTAQASTVINSIFNSYSGGMWRIGTIAATETVEYSGDSGSDNVLTALLDVMDQLPGYMMQFDQTVKPWTLNIVKRPIAVTGEGRLSRNVLSASISEDDSVLCTRIISSDLPNGKLDADTIAQYGVVEYYAGKDEEQSQASFLSDCQKYLAQHKNPLLSVSLSLCDLEQITGEALDNITLGDLYRLALPEYNVTIEQPIITISWSSVYGDPGAVSVTLANEELTLSSAFHMVAGAGGGLSGGNSLAKANKNIKVVREEVKLRAKQEYVEGLERRVDEAYVEIDAQGVEIGSTREAVNVLSGRVTQDEATLTVHANEIAARVTQTEFTALGNVVASHTSELSVQASQISSKVSQTDYNGNTIASLINQTATTILIQAAHINLDGYVTANQLEAAFATARNLTYLTASGTTISNSGGIYSGHFYLNLASGQVELGDAVRSIGPATASGGQITIPWTTIRGASGTAVTFNIADTQFYQDAVASAEATGRASIHLSSSWNANNDRLTIGKTTSGNTNSMSFLVGANAPVITYNSTTHKYHATAQATVDGTVRGAAAGADSGTEAYTDGFTMADAQYSAASNYMNRYGHADMYVKERETYYPAGNHYWYWSNNDKWSKMYIKS